MSRLRETYREDVVLGMPGAWADRQSESGSDHRTTKIGGLPDWPEPLLVDDMIRNGDLLKCKLCGGHMALVAQVHAPLMLHGQLCNERTIYIFGCAAPGCGMDPACWRTLRVQKAIKEFDVVSESCSRNSEGTSSLSVPPSVKLESSDPSQRTGDSIESLAPACLNDYSQSEGVADGNSEWWDGNLFGGESLECPALNQDAAEPVNMDELEALLRDAGLSAAAASHLNSGELDPSKIDAGRTSHRNGFELHNHKFPVLPCFYIYWQADSVTLEGRPTPSSVEAFQHSIGSTENIGEPEHSAEVWAAEEYEPDQALHVDRTYLRFKKNLDRFSEQCFRYCFGGQVIWAVEKENKVIGKCEGCGGPRVYEMQLMPPLLYFLQQAGKNASSRVSSCDDWDWLTVVSFTCAQSCSMDSATTLGGQTDWIFVEEITVLELELTSTGEKTNWSAIQDAAFGQTN